MADYGGLEEYTTPDGRTIRLPPALAQNFSQSLTPVQPPQMGAPTMADPQATQDIGPPPGAAPGLLPPVAVDSSPLPEMPAAPLPAPPIETALSPAPTLQSAPSAAARPKTDKDLLKAGFSGVLNEQNTALEEQKAAGRGAAEAEATSYDAIGEEYARRNAELEQAQVDKQKAAEEKVMRVNAATVDAEKASKAYADHKVDRSMDHPVLGAIAIAMGAIGAALQGSADNPALNLILAQMDKSVQLQLADRDKLKDVAAQKRSAIDLVRHASDDKVAVYNIAMAGETEKAVRKIEEIKARSGSAQVRANADVMVAGLREKQAGYYGQAVERTVSVDEQKKARAQQGAQFYAGLGQADRHHKDGLALAREKEANDLKQASLTAGAKGADTYSKLAKENEERGIRDPVTGEILLSAQGRKLTEDAAKLDKDAAAMRTAGKPGGDEQARLYEAKAAQLRNEARYDHAIRGRSPDQAAKAQQTVGGAQSMLSLIDKIKARAAKSGTKVINQSEMQAALETEMSILGLELKDLYTLGSLDEGASRYMNSITGGDPSKLTTGGFLGAIGIGADSSEKTAAKLDALGKQVESRGYSALSGLGVKPGDFKFRRDDAAARPESKAAAGLLDAKTPLESAAGEERGVAGKVVERIFNPVGKQPAEKRARASEERQSLKYPGLSPEQEPYMSQLLAQSKGDGAEATNARNKLVAIAADQSRPSVSTAVVNVLREEDPTLYAEAVKQLPDEAREVYEILDRGAGVKARTTVGPLIPQYRGGR